MEEWQSRENETRKERGQITLLDCQKRWNPQNVETLKSGNVEDQKSGICGNPEIRKSRNPEVSGTVPDSSGISAADIRNSARIFRISGFPDFLDVDASGIVTETSGFLDFWIWADPE